MSKVLHYEVKKGVCQTPCPYREGKFIGTVRCKECVFFNRKDTDSGMMICDYDNYNEQDLANSAKTCKVEHNHAWSEEDEHRITDTIYFLETAKKHYASTEELCACIEWLKSIKERYTWRPSDEQMSQLECVAIQNKDNILGKELMTLFNDLNKLKG